MKLFRDPGWPRDWPELIVWVVMVGLVVVFGITGWMPLAWTFMGLMLFGCIGALIGWAIWG